MKGNNLTASGHTDEMPSNVVKCEDVLENLKEGSKLVHKINGLDVSVQDVECNFMHSSLQRTDEMEKNCARLESHNKLTQKTEHTVASVITDDDINSRIASDQNNMNSDEINKIKFSHSKISLGNMWQPVAKENHDEIHTPAKETTLFKIPSRPNCITSSMHVDISSTKIEQLREALGSVLKKPLREILKAKFHSQANCAPNNEFSVMHQKHSRSSKQPPKRVHFIAEKCFKVCDKNEIKTLLSPLMKTSLSEILRSKANAQTTGNPTVLEMQKVVSNLYENTCYRNCSKEDSFTESDNSNSLLLRCDEISVETSKHNTGHTSLSDGSVYQGDALNEHEHQKDASSDESLRWLIPRTNFDCERNVINLASSKERWRTAASPLLKTSISDVLRSKLNKNDKMTSSSIIGKVSQETVPKKSSNLITIKKKKHRTILNERVTRSMQQYIQTRSKREKNKGISSDSSFKSYTLIKPRTAKLKENSHVEKTSESVVSASQICDVTTVMQETVPLVSITKKRIRKKHFRGGRYNFFSKRKNRRAKLGKYDEAGSGIQSEGGSFFTDGWPSDISVHDSFSSFSSEHLTSNDDVNYCRATKSYINLIESENITLCRKRSILPENTTNSRVLNTKSCEADDCSKLLETNHFVKVTSDTVTINTSYASQHKSHIGDHSSQFANKEDTNNACELRILGFENHELPANISSETHSLQLLTECNKALVHTETVKVNSNNYKESMENLEHMDTSDNKENKIDRLDQQDRYSLNESSLEQLQVNCNNKESLNSLINEVDNDGAPENKQSDEKKQVLGTEKDFDKESISVTCIRKIPKSELCNYNLATVSCADNITNVDEDDLNQLVSQNAGDKLREIISEKQDIEDDGVYVTITVNADGFVEDIERVDPSFVDITTLSSLVPIEESTEVSGNGSSMPVLECMPADDESTCKAPKTTMLTEDASIPEPCYTLEIMGDNVSTVTTEQFPGTEKQFGSVCLLSTKSSVDENATSEKMKNNDLQKQQLSIAGSVKGRRRSKRKFPEDHFDVDCISLASSSSTENETVSSGPKRKGKIGLFSSKENADTTSSPPKLKLETCSVFDHTGKGGPCHQMIYTSTVGLHLVNELYHSERNLLKRRIRVSLENPRLTICHHHKKVFLDKFDEIQKAGNGSGITKCSCYDSPVEAEKNEMAVRQLPLCCEAKDSIDDKVIGCSNFVTKHQLVRASEKVSRVALCEVHLWRLHHHQCCPKCGIFCTQGTFSQCVTQRKSHYQIHLFHTDCISPPSNGLNTYCPHCGTESNFRKIKLEMNIHLLPPNRSNSKSFIRSETKSLLSVGGQTDNSVQKKGESLKLLPSTASEKLRLSKVQQQTILSAMQNVNMNARSIATKAFFGPIKSGDIDRILQMLAAGFNPNHRFEDYHNGTPLHIAAETGHLAVVQLLVQVGASVDHTNDDLFTPLMVAVENNHLSVILYLLAAGAHLDARRGDGMTTLHLAAQDGRDNICSILLNTGKIDVNIQDDGGWTPLVWAAENQHLETVELLLKRGADPNIRDNEENVSLHWSAFSGNVDISQLFLDVGCELGASNMRGDTPLHISARQGNYQCVILFLARGADTKVKNCNSETPIMCCRDQLSQTWMVLSINDGEQFYSEKNLKLQGKLLHRDISRGQESMPIQCYNSEDNKPAPQDFTYVTENCEIGFVNIDRTITSLQSCRCNNKCRYPTCSCVKLSFKCWYDEKSHLLPEFNMSDPPMIFECNPGCLCWKDCSSRVVQYGIRCHLQVFRTEEIEWGVRTLQDIPKGTFVCEYVGEYVTELESEKRSDDSYIFEFDSREDIRYCLDAKYFGNVGRFINHLCDANLCPVKVFIEHQDLNFPRIAFFTTRHVKPYEELGFDYGPKFWSAKYKQGIFCLCNSSKCRYSRDSISSTLNDFSHTSEEEQSKDDTS